MKTMTDESFTEALKATVAQFGEDHTSAATYVNLLLTENGNEVGELNDVDVYTRERATAQRAVPVCIMAQVLALHGADFDDLMAVSGTISRVLTNLRSVGHPINTSADLEFNADLAQLQADSEEKWGVVRDDFLHRVH